MNNDGQAFTIEDSRKIKVFLEIMYQEYKTVYKNISKLNIAQSHRQEIKDSLVLLGELKLLNEAKLGELLDKMGLHPVRPSKKENSTSRSTILKK